MTPAFAADEFYVVQDAKTKHCTIVDKKPVDTTTTVVSPSGTVYKTRTEAEAGMKTVKARSAPPQPQQPKETKMPVLILWAVPAVLFVGGGIFLIGHMH